MSEGLLRPLNAMYSSAKLENAVLFTVVKFIPELGGIGPGV